MWDNPIVVREMRARMRNNRALGLQFIVLGTLALTVFLALVVATREQRSMTTGWLGGVLFHSIGVVQGLLLALIAPAFAAASFTLEREQQTIESLVLSPLRAGPLVRGKLLAATLFPMLLTTIVLPLLALTLLYGGIGPQDVLGTYVIQVANSLFLAALAVGWSMVCKSTATAVVATYLTVAAYLFWTLVLGIVAMEDAPFAVGALSPLLAPFVAAETMTSIGRRLPLWVPSAALLAFGTAWCMDVCLARAKELRLERGSGRPRLWPLVFCFLGGAALGESAIAATSLPGDEALEMAIVLAAIAGGLGALVFATADQLAARALAGWWKLHRPLTSSAPLFVALAPWCALLGVWLLTRGASSVPSAAEYQHGLRLATSASGMLFVSAWFLVWLQQHLGGRWPTIWVGLALLSLLHLLYAMLLGTPIGEALSEAVALAPYACPYTGSITDWIPVGTGTCVQGLLLALLWVVRATPAIKPKPTAVPARPARTTPA